MPICSGVGTTLLSVRIIFVPRQTLGKRPLGNDNKGVVAEEHFRQAVKCGLQPKNRKLHLVFDHLPIQTGPEIVAAHLASETPKRSASNSPISFSRRTVSRNSPAISASK